MKRILNYPMFLESNKFNPDILGDFFKQKKTTYFFSHLLSEENGVVIYDSDLDLKGLFLNKIDLPVKINIINGEFNCSENGLTTLEGGPDKVIGNYNCNNNLKLNNLVGGPSQVDGEYDAINCGLTSLVGAPLICKGDFCVNNNLLEDFTGISEARWDGDIYLVKNPLYSFQGLPELFKNKIYINYTPLNEIWTLMEKNQHALQLSITYPFIGKVNDVWSINANQFEDICSETGVNLPTNWRESIKSYKIYE